MKNIKIWLMVLLVSLAGVGCEKDFDEINTNPNRPEDVPLTNVLLSSISQGVRRTHGANMNMTYGGLWAQHYAKIQYIDEDWYAYRPDAFTTHWDALYAGPLADLENIIAKADNPSNMLAAAMTMKAYYFSIITDAWGMVPYSEALSVDRTTTPVYDEQSAIYADLVAQLKIAADMFGQSDDLGAGDIIYNGNTAMWKKFANSLRARLLNRGANANPAFATELASLLSDPTALINSNSENAFITYPDATPANSNPLYSNRHNDGRNDHAVSETLVNAMTGDPRLPVYADVNSDGQYVGQPNGALSEPSPFTIVSQIGTAFRDDPAAPSFLMTYAEVLFIRSEAAGFDKTLYTDAINASCAQHGVSADQAFLDATSAAFDANAAEAVGDQKWIALFGDGCEAFTEYRRTGFPTAIVEVPGSNYPGQGVPTRFAYPTSETGNNLDNLNAAISAQNITDGIFSDKMWWAN
jgi:hypothetical protein